MFYTLHQIPIYNVEAIILGDVSLITVTVELTAAIG